MAVKEIHKRSGSVFTFFGYTIILIFWYLLVNSTFAFGSPLVYWGISFFISPLIQSLVFGGINSKQNNPNEIGGTSFFQGIKKLFWQMLAADVIYTVFSMTIIIVSMVAIGAEQTLVEENPVLYGIIAIPLSAISLFWFSAIAVERKIFLGLGRALKTLNFTPVALITGLTWGAIGLADTLIFDLQAESIPLWMNILRSGVFALIRTFAVMYALSAYKVTWNKTGKEIDQAVQPDDRTPETASRSEISKVSFGFAFLSFVPILHLVALILGIIALKREKRFMLKPAIACGVGVFFTLMYLLLAGSFLLETPAESVFPDNSFMFEANSDLESYDYLIQTGGWRGISQQLDRDFPTDAGRSWTLDCASAFAKLEENDLDGALSDFYAAFEKEPDQGEFYFYYGLSLLDNDKDDLALIQFKRAVAVEPDLVIAHRYIELVENAYKPSVLVSSLMFIVILLILFTFHEYGHAFAAWKLGDDTAKELGRLTLNPVSHLDLFGSILLPGILLLQQSEFLFGWAKPVPVDTRNFKNPRRDHMRVSFAGPAANFIISMVVFLLIGVILFVVRIIWPDTMTLNISDPFSSMSMVGPPFATWIVYLIFFLKQLFYTSLILGFFNLIPVPPLDGAWILAGLLPERFHQFLMQARRFSYVIFLILIITPAVDILLSVPIGLSWGFLYLLTSVMGLV